MNIAVRLVIGTRLKGSSINQLLEEVSLERDVVDLIRRLDKTFYDCEAELEKRTSKHPKLFCVAMVYQPTDRLADCCRVDNITRSSINTLIAAIDESRHTSSDVSDSSSASSSIPLVVLSSCPASHNANTDQEISIVKRALFSITYLVPDDHDRIHMHVHSADYEYHNGQWMATEGSDE